MNNNLPAGVTDRDIDRHMGADVGTEECECCNGTGKTGSECCGEKIGEDGRCTRCKEVADEGTCEECKGKGYIEFSIEERKQDAKDEAAIDRWEEDRAFGR